ncbi:MAG TPA: hypothetical protein DG761_11330 [Gammaproteobacteria bacterium]|nr:hypothetical protein [Acidiferrobacteraceae bacterium]MDP6790508.1 hypothetical protein [Arenicellales bacterium]HCX88606.1 hypothetical protein [Gammaproteobacteria bacterium]
MDTDDATDSSAVMADPVLTANGWVKRYLADSSRAREARELYAAMGYEVYEQQLDPADFPSSCGDCPSVVCKGYVMIYTRRRSV